MKKVIILSGIPGSGKSTDAKWFLPPYLAKFERVVEVTEG